LKRIGELAIAEHAAWTARNSSRAAMKKWHREGGFERGEEVSEATTDAEALTEWKALESEAIRTQRRLTTARAATRRAIARATGAAT
jgi:hypothetical protein